MKKLFQWLTGSVVKEIGNAIDKLTTTEEEKLIIKKQVQEILEQADTQCSRYKLLIVGSQTWQVIVILSKNIRPLILIYITVIFTALAFTDGNIGEFQIAKEYIPIFQTLLVTVYGAYFVGRTWEKATKINKK